jgi:hypothetical protein
MCRCRLLTSGSFNILLSSSTSVIPRSDWVNSTYKFLESSGYYNLNIVVVFWFDGLLFVQFYFAINSGVSKDTVKAIILPYVIGKL